jgi:hypothetical protein
MANSIESYLNELKAELEGSDIATIQDALADAEEHLSTALKNQQIAQPGLDNKDALQIIIEQYGTPVETASAYKEVERRTSPALVRSASQKPHSLLGRFFGIYIDPKAWGAMLYMLISLVTGIFYFTWAVTGLSLSVAFALFIFGLPFVLFFILSVRGLALLEGRIVEALLGVRMPRRPLFASQSGKWMARIKTLLLDKHSWLAMLYMILQLILGVLYFTLLVVLLSFSLAFLSIPILQLGFHLPVAALGGTTYFLPSVYLPLCVLAGILLLTITMHLAKGIGQLHGRFAKFMLVTE